MIVSRQPAGYAYGYPGRGCPCATVQTRRPAGLGFTLPELPAPLAGLDWKTVVLVAVAAFIVWRLLLSPRAGERRRRLRDARRRYQAQVARIRAEHPRI